ncbi:MAG: hypothetical protein Q7W30_01675 [Coriobacteriia bacterium]|nr:hypothetical protein [Coriobacteriia bacterium]
MKSLGRNWFAWALVGLLAGSLLAGCGGSAGSSGTGTSTPADKPAAPSKPPATDTVDYAALLTPADVETVSGFTGLKTVPYDPSIGAGGKVNIAEADGQLVAMLLVHGPEFYKIWKGDGQTFLRDYTPTVGDESFIGPAASVTTDSYIFGFRKGSYSVVVDTFFRAKGVRKVLSVDQLAELARIVASRL